MEVQRAAAEQLPFEDRTFDATLAQLVVHFMAQPVTGLQEMARVTRRDGVVAACVWDHAGGGGPLSGFWKAVHELDARRRGRVAVLGPVERTTRCRRSAKGSVIEPPPAYLSNRYPP